MEYVLATQLDDWFFSESLNVAQRTIRVTILSKGFLLILSDAVFMQTRRVHMFVVKAIASVSAL
jgi:hypothetical protein